LLDHPGEPVPQQRDQLPSLGFRGRRCPRRTRSPPRLPCGSSVHSGCLRAPPAVHQRGVHRLYLHDGGEVSQ